MFVYVQLLNGFKKPLVYKIPKHMETENFLNKCVIVPLRQKKISALVIQQTQKLFESRSFEIKEIIGIKAFPKDSKYHEFIAKSASLYFSTPLFFYQKLRQFFKKNSDLKKDSPPTHTAANTISQNHLTDEQKTASSFIKKSLEIKEFTPIVLHGVTGSGKTEVYKDAIRKTIENNKTALFLLPEISMAIQFKNRLEQELGTIPILSFHSSSKTSEKSILWQALLKSKPIVIIGVHLPVLLPIANLGLIIIDEEHEAGFEEKKHPKINSKYLALLRASLYKIPIVLGSATPCVQTLYQVAEKKWHFFKLTQRFAGAFPQIETILLPKEKNRRSFWISKKLEIALQECLSSKKQAIIFLNRRGYSFFVQCKKCGFVVECPYCSVSLTSHQKADKEFLLSCHYCNYSRNVPHSCSECKAPNSPFLTKGIGTQQLVEILQNMFPLASIARADLDTTSKKNSWAQTAKSFEEGKIDILVGTKSITKGFHFPGVTLVGVIWGDLHAHIPVFNATEQCLQQLIQVAGRAGREQSNSKVIIQTMQDHDLFKFINEIDYLSFAKEELEARKEAWYPPFCRLIRIELQHSNPSLVENDAKKIAVFLQEKMATKNISILGPAKPAIHKIQKIEVRHIFIKTHSLNQVESELKVMLGLTLKSKIFIQFT